MSMSNPRIENKSRLEKFTTDHASKQLEMLDRIQQIADAENTTLEMRKYLANVSTDVLGDVLLALYRVRSATRYSAARKMLHTMAITTKPGAKNGSAV